MSLSILPVFHPYPLLAATIPSLLLLWAAVAFVTKSYPFSRAATEPNPDPTSRPKTTTDRKSDPPTPAESQSRPIPITSTVIPWRASFSFASMGARAPPFRLSGSVEARKGSSSDESLAASCSETESLYPGLYTTNGETVLAGVGGQFVPKGYPGAGPGIAGGGGDNVDRRRSRLSW